MNLIPVQLFSKTHFSPSLVTLLRSNIPCNNSERLFIQLYKHYRDVYEYEIEIRSKAEDLKPFNYRMNYRSAVATRGLGKYQFYGSALNRVKPTKDLTISQLYNDAMTIPQLVKQRDLFDVKDFDFRPCPTYEFLFQSNLSFIENEPKKKVRKEYSLSTRSKAKIKDKIMALYRSNLRSHYFVTLTFINKVEDEKSVKLLNNFLTTLRKKYGKFEYIWIAERQEGKRSKAEEPTLNVHFHCIFSKRFDIVEINSLWVLHQYKGGVQHNKYTMSEILTLVEGGGVQTALNPVMAVKIKGINSLSSYLTKYVTKNENKLFCRVWHCSRSVSALNTHINCGRVLFNDIANNPSNISFNRTSGEIYVSKTIVTDHAIIRTIINKRYYLKYFEVMELVNKKLLDDKYREQYVPYQYELSDQYKLSTDYEWNTN